MHTGLKRQRLDLLAMRLQEAYIGPKFDENGAVKAQQALRNLLSKPTERHITAAIEQACQETGGLPLDVTTGRLGHDPVSIAASRARLYTALALRAVFEGELAPKEIASMVGIQGVDRQQGYMYSIDRQVRQGVMWWSDQAFMRVIEAIEAV